MYIMIGKKLDSSSIYSDVKKEEFKKILPKPSYIFKRHYYILKERLNDFEILISNYFDPKCTNFISNPELDTCHWKITVFDDTRFAEMKISLFDALDGSYLIDINRNNGDRITFRNSFYKFYNILCDEKLIFDENREYKKSIIKQARCFEPLPFDFDNQETDNQEEIVQDFIPLLKMINQEYHDIKHNGIQMIKGFIDMTNDLSFINVEIIDSIINLCKNTDPNMERCALMCLLSIVKKDMSFSEKIKLIAYATVKNPYSFNDTKQTASQIIEVC